MKSWIECRWRGVLSSVVIGAAALFVSNTYGGPTVLYALLLGMAFHFISEDDRAVAGIELCAKNFLRIGVGLLGARITAEELAQLSLGSITVLITGVFATLDQMAACGRCSGRRLGCHLRRQCRSRLSARDRQKGIKRAGSFGHHRDRDGLVHDFDDPLPDPLRTSRV